MEVYHPANFKNCFEKNRSRPKPYVLIKSSMAMVSSEVYVAATQII